MSRDRVAVAVMAVALSLVPSVLAPSAAAASPQLRDTGHACPDGRVAEDGFDDVPDSNVHEAAIDCAVDRELATGRTPTTYEPAAPLTRGQLASFVQRMLAANGDNSSGTPGDHFTDDQGSVHEDAINDLAGIGVVSGRTGTTYEPDGLASRGHVVAVLVRAIEHRTEDVLAASTDWFDDDGSGVHEQAINGAAEAGLATGTSEGRFEPDRAAQRDHVASVLVRSLDLLFARGYGGCFQEYPPYLRISRVEAAPVGDDLKPGAGEFVELRSEWCENVDLDGWQLRDRDGNVVPIADGHLIRPQETFRVYTGPGPSSEDRYHAGRDQEVWDDAGDTVTLWAPGAVEADSFAY